MARIIKCDSMYMALVNRAEYKKEILKYERKLRLWNIFHRFLVMVMFLSGTTLMWMCTAVDDIEHEKFVWSTIAVSIMVFIVSALMAKMPRPKLPIGVKVYRGRYVIAAAIYPGDDLVEVNNDYVYEDGRRCKIIPCDVK